MKKYLNYFLIFALVPVLVLSSCKKTDDDDTTDDPATEFEILKSYMADNDLDLADIYGSKDDGTFWVKPGSAVIDTTDFSVPNFYVIDIRSAEDFADGQIKDAHNTTLGNILDAAANATKPKILVVCYTGQTAARAVSALRLSGYSESYSLKWGMCGWNATFNAKWESNATDLNPSADQWNNDPEPALDDFSYPVINTSETDGAKILEAQVDAMLSNPDWKQTNTDVLDSPSSYFIINKWSSNDWTAYGHIVGAYRYDMDNGLGLDGLDKLDPSNPFVFYCYTGQTSSISTGYLQVMGYTNARSLMFGANAIIHSDLVDGATTAGKSWHGAGSGSELNYGYYVDGVLVPPSK